MQETVGSSSNIFKFLSPDPCHTVLILFCFCVQQFILRLSLILRGEGGEKSKADYQLCVSADQAYVYLSTEDHLSRKTRAWKYKHLEVS